MNTRLWGTWLWLTLIWFTAMHPSFAWAETEAEWLNKLEALRVPTQRTTPPPVNRSGEAYRQYWDDFWAIEHPRRWRLAEAEQEFLTTFPDSVSAPAIRRSLVEDVIACLSSRGEIGTKALAWIESKLQQPDLPVEEALPIYSYQLNMIGIQSGGGNIDILVPVPRRSDDKSDALQELLEKFAKRYPNATELGELYVRAADYLHWDDKIAALRFLSLAEPLLDKNQELREKAQGMRFRFTAVGKPAPPVKFTALDGRIVDVSSYEGKVVLLDFWATWCSPCVAEIPRLRTLYERWHEKGLEVIGISLDTDRAKLESFVKAEGLAWPQSFEGKKSDSEFARQYGVTGIPSVWLINQKGRIVAIDPEDLERSVSALLMPVDPPKIVEGSRTMKIRVVDPEGKPLNAVKISRSVWTKQPYKKNEDYWTDATGEIEFEFPNQTDILRVWARIDSYVPEFISWEVRSMEGPIPQQFVFELEKGMEIGGVVVNEDGQPVAGARVEVEANADGNEIGEAEPDRWLANGDDARITDDSGYWSLDNAPEGIELLVKVSHPDYVSHDDAREHYDAQKVTVEDLRQTKARFVLRRGISVIGTVRDAKGAPIENAIVVRGDDPYLEWGSQEVLTSKNGNYRLPPLFPGKLALTAIAPGSAPQVQEIDVAAGMGPVDFSLSPGNAVRIHFVDEAGDPIPSVYVDLEKWRGRRALHNIRHPNVLETRIPRKSGENGIFEWDWAPDDEVKYRFWKKGFVPVESRLGPGEHRVRMERDLSLPAA